MTLPPGTAIHATTADRYDRVLTPEALAFVVALQREFNPRRKQLLAARITRQQQLDAGVAPDFLAATRQIRETPWTVAPIPADLQDRRVEITGPVDRKMIINALNSGATRLHGRLRRLHHTHLGEPPRRPAQSHRRRPPHHHLRRPLHAQALHAHRKPRRPLRPPPRLAPRGAPPRRRSANSSPALSSTSASTSSTTRASSLSRGSGPYFYLPKLESHLEARLWNDIFLRAQELLSIPRGTIRATVLIETILAAFEMDEILFELREHSAGLNCGRWDYIFSFIKKLAADTSVLLPDRSQVTMTTHFMRSYSKLCIKTCHRRRIHAMGGMSAFIPIKSDPEANERALAQVRADKEREASDGHDGTWVAHPGLVPVAKEVFDRLMPGPNQIDKQLPDYNPTAADLLAIPTGTITEAGLKQNIAVGLGYVEAWLRGIGCVPLFNLMEDAATAEISRAQLWQWVHHGAKLSDGPNSGSRITTALCDEYIDAELARATRNRPSTSLPGL